MLAFMVPVLGICVSKQKMVENWRYKDGEDGAPSCGSYHGWKLEIQPVGAWKLLWISQKLWRVNSK